MAKQMNQREKQAARHYAEAEAKQFGNLHERMKYLIACARNMGQDKFDNTTWNALWDLETEVSYHTPAEPPYGSRSIRAADLQAEERDE